MFIGLKFSRIRSIKYIETYFLRVCVYLHTHISLSICIHIHTDTSDIYRNTDRLDRQTDRSLSTKDYLRNYTIKISGFDIARSPEFRLLLSENPFQSHLVTPGTHRVEPSMAQSGCPCGHILSPKEYAFLKRIQPVYPALSLPECWITRSSNIRTALYSLSNKKCQEIILKIHNTLLKKLELHVHHIYPASWQCFANVPCWINHESK